MCFIEYLNSLLIKKEGINVSICELIFATTLLFFSRVFSQIGRQSRVDGGD